MPVPFGINSLEEYLRRVTGFNSAPAGPTSGAEEMTLPWGGPAYQPTSRAEALTRQAQIAPVQVGPQAGAVPAPATNKYVTDYFNGPHFTQATHTREPGGPWQTAMSGPPVPASPMTEYRDVENYFRPWVGGPLSREDQAKAIQLYLGSRQGDAAMMEARARQAAVDVQARQLAWQQSPEGQKFAITAGFGPNLTPQLADLANEITRARGGGPPASNIAHSMISPKLQGQAPPTLQQDVAAYLSRSGDVTARDMATILAQKHGRGTFEDYLANQLKNAMILGELQQQDGFTLQPTATGFELQSPTTTYEYSGTNPNAPFLEFRQLTGMGSSNPSLIARVLTRKAPQQQQSARLAELLNALYGAQ